MRRATHQHRGFRARIWSQQAGILFARDSAVGASPSIGSARRSVARYLRPGVEREPRAPDTDCR
jgi:hypothetical protein